MTVLFTQLCEGKYSALIFHMLDMFNINDNCALIQVSKSINLRCKERAILYLSKLDTWTMRGCFTLGVYKRFFLAIIPLLEKHLTSSNGVKMIFHTELKPLIMTVTLSWCRLKQYECFVKLIPTVHINNPICMENGAKLLRTNMVNNLQYEAYIESFNMLLDYLPLLSAKSSKSSSIQVDGKKHHIPDIRHVNMISGSEKYEISQLVRIVYCFLLGFARDTIIYINRKECNNSECEIQRYMGYDLLKELMKAKRPSLRLID